MRENIVYINDINFKNGIINIDSKTPLSMVAFESKDKYIIKDNIENSNINITKLLEKNYRYIKSGLYKLKIWRHIWRFVRFIFRILILRPWKIVEKI